MNRTPVSEFLMQFLTPGLTLMLLMLLAGCAVFTYELTPPPLTASAAPTHTGKDCGVVFFGLGGGDLSAGEAMRLGGITTPTKITLSQNYVLLFGEHCVIVEGEGPGMPQGPRYPQPQ